jgi:hypothetical protein
MHQVPGNVLYTSDIMSRTTQVIRRLRRLVDVNENWQLRDEVAAGVVLAYAQHWEQDVLPDNEG